MKKYLTFIEAVDLGIQRIRQPIWHKETDYLKIDLVQVGKNFSHGPFLELYSEVNELIGQKNPQRILFFHIPKDATFEEYKGALSKDENTKHGT